MAKPRQGEIIRLKVRGRGKSKRRTPKQLAEFCFTEPPQPSVGSWQDTSSLMGSSSNGPFLGLPERPRELREVLA